jgi:hypothetical protein
MLVLCYVLLAWVRNALPLSILPIEGRCQTRVPPLAQWQVRSDPIARNSCREVT